MKRNDLIAILEKVPAEDAEIYVVEDDGKIRELKSVSIEYPNRGEVCVNIALNPEDYAS